MNTLPHLPTIHCVLEDLERVRAEEARKAMLNEKQIEFSQRTHEKMLAIYCSINDSLCNLELGKQPEQAALTIRSDATKLCSMCKPNTDLYRAVQDLIFCFEPDINSDFSKAYEYRKIIHWRICEIGKHLLNTTLMDTIDDGTTRTEMHTQ